MAIPALLRQVIDGRLARLGDESQRLLAVAAVIGHEVPLAVWATVGEVGEDDVLAVAEEGLEAHLLVEGASGENVRFAHALIRESLFEGIPAIRRRRIHRRVGEALVSERVADPDVVAYHFQQAGDARAVEWLVTAGERARLAYARLTAAERFDAALALMEMRGADAGERGWLLLRLALLRRYADRRKAMVYLESATQMAAEAGDALLAASVRCNQGLLWGYGDDLQRGIAAMTEAVAALDALPPIDEAVRLRVEGMGIATDPRHHRGLLALWLAIVGDFGRVLPLAEGLAKRMPETAGPTLDGAFAPDVYRALGWAYAVRGQPVAAYEAFEQSRVAYRAIGDLSQWSSSMTLNLWWVVLPYRTDDLPERERLAAEIEEVSRRSTTVTGDLFRLRAGNVPLLVLEGKWDEALELHRAIRAQGTGTLSQRGSIFGSLAHARGDDDLAWTLINEALPAGPATTWVNIGFAPTLKVIQLAARLALDRGDLPTANEWLETHDRWLAWAEAVLGQSERQALWAQYHRQAGDADQAYQHAQRALAHATEPRQPLALITAHRLLGELDTEAGRFDSAQTHLDASLALADACQAPYERALTLLAMAELRAATGENETARALLDEVKAICAPLGAMPALARADGLAARLTRG